MPTTSRLHAMTWLLWAVAAAVTLQLATSPVYVVLVIAVAIAVFEAHRSDHTLARALPVLVGIGVAFATIRVVLTALTTHTGLPDTTWFTVPEFTLPRLLGGFTVGGAIEGAVVLDAAAQGLVVVGIMTVFGVFNAVASHHELLQSMPRAFHVPGLVVTVALAFVPSTMEAIAAVREADRARTGGRVVRRGRLLRLTVPIVESGLERAMALAESMDSRGFARLDPEPAEEVASWLGLGSLLALGGALLALVGGRSAGSDGAADLVAPALGALGVALLGGAVLLSSSATRTTRYRPRRLARVDAAIAAAVLLAPAGIVALDALGNDTLHWVAYPVQVPAFSIPVACCIGLLAAPRAVRAAPLAGTEAEADLEARGGRDAAAPISEPVA